MLYSAMTKKRGKMLKLRHKIAYGSGNAGLALVNILVQTWLFFFLAPGTGRVLIPASVVGGVWLAGRVVDALIDPPISTWTDRHRSKLGRRLPFMLWTGLPLGVCTALLFSEGIYSGPIWLRAAVLALALGAFYLFFSIWAVPYNALVADLSGDPAERVDLSTSAASFNLLGTGIAMIGFGKIVEIFVRPTPAAASDAFSGGAYLPAAVLIAILAVISFYASSLGLLRKKASGDEPSRLSFFEAAGSVFKNKPFVGYVIGMNVFWAGFAVINVSVPYYITVLMGEGVGFTSVGLGVTFGVALLSFPLMNALPKRIGKRRAVMLSTIIMALSLALIWFIPSPPFGLSRKVFGLIVMGMAGLPMAGLFIIPNAMVADLSDFRLPNGDKPGEAIYYGVQGVIQNFMIGVVTALAGLLFDVFGKTPDASLGVRLTSPIGAAFALFAFFAFWRGYPDDRKGLFKRGAWKADSAHGSIGP
jgi:glycoside/pentoside/hexuronide:cation symporter, GPH family